MSSNRKMKVWKAKDGWRWQLWRSSDIVAESGGAYENKGKAVEMAAEFAGLAAHETEFEVDECEEDA